MVLTERKVGSGNEIAWSDKNVMFPRTRNVYDQIRCGSANFCQKRIIVQMTQTHNLVPIPS